VQRAGSPNDLGAVIPCGFCNIAFESMRTEAAKVGRFLIVGGDQESLSTVKHVDAIFYLDSLEEFHSWLKASGAEIVHGVREVTAGRNLTARHPDGLVVEYFEAAAS
jgi:hypothetical protein